MFFWNSLAFSMIQQMLAICSLVPLPFLNPAEHLEVHGSCTVEEQYCVGTWNVRSMNQGKLDMVKQEMARVNINILGISELKWMRMSEV